MFFRHASFLKNAKRAHAQCKPSAAEFPPRPRRLFVLSAADSALKKARGNFNLGIWAFGHLGILMRRLCRRRDKNAGFPFLPRSSITPAAAFLFAFCFLPFALLAADGGGADAPTVTHKIQLEFIIPAALLSALIAWFTAKANAEKKAQRQPPLGEDVARTYATKQELEQCRARCKGDVSDVRGDLQRLEERFDAGLTRVHQRIDSQGKSLAEMNLTLGEIVGYLKGKTKGGGPSLAV